MDSSAGTGDVGLGDLASQIVELSPVIILVIDRSGTLQYINPYGAELLQYEDRDLIGADAVELLVLADDRDRVRGRLAGLSEGDEHSVVRSIMDGQGCVRQVEWWDRVLLDSQGDAEALLSIGQDVTERVRLEADAAWRARQLAEAQRLSGIGTGARNPTTGRVHLSDEVYTVFEIGRDSETNLLRVILDRVHPDDRQAARESFTSLGDDADSTRFEGRLVMDDGRTKHVRLVSAMVPDEHGEALYVGAVQDLTEFRTIEQELSDARDLLSEAQELAEFGSWSFNLVTGGMSWSPELFRIFGLDPDRDQPDGQLIVGLTHPDDRERVQAASQRAIETGEPVEVEYRLLLADGRVKWVRMRGRYEVSTTGEPLRSFGTLQDVTRSALAEQTLVQLTMQLEEAQRIGQMGSWTTDLATGATEWSSETFRILGLHEQEFDAVDTVYEVVETRTHPDDRHQLGRFFEVPDPADADYDMLHRLVEPDGSTMWLRVRGRFVFDDAGQAVRSMGTIQDVTDSKEAELELARIARQLEQAQRVARIGSWTLDLRANTFDASPELFRIFQVDPDRPDSTTELVEALRARIHPDDRDHVQRARDVALADGGAYDVVCRLLLPGAEVRWVRIRGLSEVDDAGQPVRSMGSVQDVTDSEEASAVLARTARQLEEAQRLAQLGSWTLDLTTGALEWSLEIYRIFELDPEVFEATYDAFLEATHPDDRGLIDEAYQRSVAERTSYELVHRLLMPDGRVKWVRERGRTEYADDGTPERSMGTVQDVTQVVEAEREMAATARELEEAQRLAQIGSWTREFSTGELVWAREVYRIFEYVPGDFPSENEAFMRRTHPDDRDEVRRCFESAIEQREPYDITHRLLMPDGSVKWVRERGATEYSADGAPLRTLGTVQDVTEVRTAQMAIEELNAGLERKIGERTIELVRAVEAAEAANRAKNVFLASMSHEMRTPLNAVIGYSQLVELDERLPDDLREQLGQVRRAGTRLLGLVSDVLDLAKIEAGHLEVALERVSLADVVRGCLAAADAMAAERGIEIRTPTTVNEYWVVADPARLTQVISNVVSNAVKYNDPGGTVDVSCAMVDVDKVRLKITDTGAGIPPERIDELFEPFTRLGLEAGVIEGSGIGLAVARQLAESMGASISVESELGVGSSFLLDLTGGQFSAD